MNIETDRLKFWLGQAFDSGYQNSQDLRDQIIDDLMVDVIKDQTPKADEGYRIYKVAELKKMPAGTVFHHSIRGRCYLFPKSDGTNCMQFEQGQASGLTSDADPWDHPMKLLHTEKI